MNASWRREALSDRTQAQIARDVETTDFLRGGPRLPFEAGRWKEWTHFVVVTPDVTLLANFSFAEERPVEGGPPTLTARAILMVSDPTWDGDVERAHPEDTELTPGAVGCRIGPHQLSWDGRAFRVRMRLTRRKVACDLRIVPITRPTATSRLPFSQRDRVQWLVFPRCLAWGDITVGDRTHRVEAASCYHDHNWGAFGWGEDFAWEWGFAVPDDPDNPWSLVFSRVTDARRHAARSTGLFLWRGSRYHRLFLEQQVRYAPRGSLALHRALKVPRVMGLLRPGDALGVPAHLTVEARKGDDTLVCEATLSDGAQIVLPSEIDPTGTQAINEIGGRLTVHGTVRGEPVHLTGPAVLEFVRRA